MKSRPFKLSIENPCSQDWNSMTENEQGRFCERCAKSVIDYTGLSDKELIHAISSSSNPICGRLKPQQLNRMIGDEKMISVQSPYKFLTGLFILGASKSAFSANVAQQKEQIVQFVINEGEVDLKLEAHDTLINIIEGRIIDEGLEPIPGVIVKIRDTELKAVSDLDGKFKFVLSNSFDLKMITLHSEYVEGTIEDVIVDRSKKGVAIEMMLVSDSGSEMIVGQLKIRKPKKWWQFWKRH
ncbi:hypothetical protein [Fluviicola sp.]|uniref:hypothetical protein n=1 Tax=Fluviicola sp. TaxID=1917219 RepID=UPI003D26B9F0